ncbi:DUF1569 domain-containing protein [Parvicella tangerina]|uniref:DUF1569 domain-containing protein n=1 Tax=Parvicella tangerina TaxID=2829795 RepID=A0A916JMB4_9FLAO|nr:DUF1569 domain-containing protein [Parvicella tangerina]CAG5081361.1 hypothetical protein CRYO30217_01607 [Parvicella tangerina]
MEILNTFDSSTTEKVLNRLEKLTVDSQPKWGKMNVGQMLAHLNVAYEMAYGEKKVKNGAIAKFMLKKFVKPIVVGDKPYKKSSRTAPAFMVVDEKDFSREKERLMEYIRRTEAHGEAYFEGRESASFGPLTAKEWSNMFYKHIDHHFSQFGV